jgi:hypothetical protein
VPRFFVRLDTPDFDRLRELARVERRYPADQAAYLLAHVLKSERQVEITEANDAGRK